MTYAMTQNRARLLALAGTLILAFAFFAGGARAEETRRFEDRSKEGRASADGREPIVGDYPCDGGPNTPECKKWLEERRFKK